MLNSTISLFEYSISNILTGITKKWRPDRKCGKTNPLPDGTPAQCDPDGDIPCCNSSGWCGSSTTYCSCEDCTDYKLLKDWNESNGTQKWRYDGMCGSYYLLPDGTPGQCDPDGDIPCCSDDGSCSLDKSDCLCTECVDYRIVREIEKSGENCTLARLSTGYLKHVCYDDVHKNIEYKCETGDNYYEVNYRDSDDINVTEVCDNDPHFYQVCGFNTEITNTDVLCGGYICEEKEGGKHKYIKCTGDNCKPENRDCSTSSETNCDGNCKYKYGVTCTSRGEKEHFPVGWVCNGYRSCDDGKDEQNCRVTNSTVYTCTHYRTKMWYYTTRTVPLHNYTRCSVFNVNKAFPDYPYCLNYLDQTNCSDIERVGGYCEVNGYMSTVSKYMVCYEYDEKSKQKVTLCDDGIQNKCLSPSTSDCRVHKHLMCDGVADCSDGSDETHEMCEVTTVEIYFLCRRRFLPKTGETRIPLSWIMDNVTDCLNGEDESSNLWVVCPGHTIIPASACEDVFLCPGANNTIAYLDQICKSASCGDATENEVCRIARDFPSLNKIADMSNGVTDNFTTRLAVPTHIIGHPIKLTGLGIR